MMHRNMDSFKSPSCSYLSGMNDQSPMSVPAPRQRKPDWIRVKAPVSKGYTETRDLMRGLGLDTGVRGSGLSEHRRMLEPRSTPR